MDAVEEICDQITILNKSKIVLQGSLTELKSRYSTKNYIVNGKGELVSNDVLKVIKTHSKQWLIEPLKDIKVVIEHLNKQLELTSFQKEEPSLNEIFIKSFNLV